MNNFQKKLDDINEEIETTRLMLNQLIETKNFNLLDPDVIELSQYLDLLLTEYDNIQK